MGVKRVAVLGATTPVGRAIIRVLVEDARVEHVIAVGAEDTLGRLPFSAEGRLRYVKTDLTRSRSVRELLFGPVRDDDVEAIVHAAQHRSAVDGGRRVYALNVEATREILRLCEHHPTVRRFVLRSWGEIYRVRADAPCLIDEEEPLDLAAEAPQWVRDRAEADLAACACLGVSPLAITVLRCAECLAPDCGSQLWDYVQSRVCFHPLGYDPMMNLLSIEDLAHAVRLALDGPSGVYNVPGKDTLPLSEVIARFGRVGAPVPDFFLLPLYSLRSRVLGTQFRYDLARWRFHFSSVLDGRRAKERLGYEPRFGIDWPRLPSWR